MLWTGLSSKQTKDTWRPVQRAAAVSLPRGGMRQNHSDCLPSLQVGLALLLMCCGLELEYVWLIFVILPVPHSLQGRASDGEQVGRGLPPILFYGQEHRVFSLETS